MFTRTVNAAFLAAGLMVQTHAFAQVSTFPIQEDREAGARKQWHDTLAKQPMSEPGCFHATYPNYAWEKVECKATPKDAPISLQTVGNGSDYTEISSGLIYAAQGILKVNDVTSVQTVGAGCSYLGAICSGVNGQGQYSIQLNTNNDQWTSACLGGNTTCKVWEQFVYVSQFYYSDLNIIGLQNSPALYIQFWMIDYGASCPNHWRHVTVAGKGDCVLNSNHVSPPYIAVSDLSNVTMVAGATPGGQDVVEFFHKRTDSSGKIVEDVWSVADNDNTLKIGTVWQHAEFNIFGNGGGSEALFNNGASISGMVQLMDGSHATPLCSSVGGTTGETNNLTMRGCSTSVVDGYPTINFTESSPLAIIRNPPGNPVASP